MWMDRREGTETSQGWETLNTFKIKPGEWEELTKGGLRVHAILNGKEVSQWFALMKDGRKNILVVLTEPPYEEKDPLEGRRHGESDQV